MEPDPIVPQTKEANPPQLTLEQIRELTAICEAYLEVEKEEKE